jgi:pimeloyl-ACP methyl ester carboxylesterase
MSAIHPQPTAKPTVLFVHGFLDGATVWDELRGELRPDVDALAINLAGMGARASEAGPYTLERFADDVGHALDALDLPVVLVGHSMGAQVAELVAARRASQVRALVLLTPMPLAGPNLPEDAIATFRSLGGNPTAQRDVRRQLSVHLSDGQLDRLGKLGDQASAAAVAAFADAWNQGHPAGALQSRYSGPVLIVAGVGDPFVTADLIASAVAPRFDAPVLAAVSEAGHWPHVEQSAALATTLRGFLQSAGIAALSTTPQQGWTGAFANKSADAFAKAFAPEVVLEASVLAKPVVGREQVKTVMGTASQIYEALTFTQEAAEGHRSYLEWEAQAFGGEALRGITVLTKNGDGQIVHAAIHHRPLGAALKFSTELRKRLNGKVGAEHFYDVA